MIRYPESEFSITSDKNSSEFFLTKDDTTRLFILSDLGWDTLTILETKTLFYKEKKRCTTEGFRIRLGDPTILSNTFTLTKYMNFSDREFYETITDSIYVW